MPIIKRYPNRKLYDTQARQYITLEGIASLVRDGLEIQVVDHASGEDLTAITLSQIIVEMEKKQSGFIPHATLTGLIRAGGERLRALPLPIEQVIEHMLEKRSLPTRQDVERLEQQLDELSTRLEELLASNSIQPEHVDPPKIK